MASDSAVPRGVYTGLFLVALATLMFEILLTRIFSVTMYYHFAFFAVSVAMFGMTFGAVIVYLRPTTFTPERTTGELTRYALLFAIASILSIAGHLVLPFLLPSMGDSDEMARAVATFLIVAVPFVFSGICVSLALTRFPARVGRLYAADLAGAATGCVLLIPVINSTGGPTAVFIVGILAAIGGLAFAARGVPIRLRATAGIVTVGLLVAAAAQIRQVQSRGTPLLRVQWAKGHVESKPALERWNSFSRVAVLGGVSDRPTEPFGWALSTKLPPDLKVNQLGLNIDADAYTVMTAFADDTQKLRHLKYDVTNLAHHLRQDARVLVIGVGGGRDVLAALAFGQQHVTGVEINGAILDIVNQKYGAYTGRLDRRSDVRLVTDEARSYVARSGEEFDIIQASLIDTWAATASGAFTFTENALYTLEAWRMFMEHLTPRGLLTFSRWYVRDRPAEIYRLVSLAAVALRERGITNPAAHMALVRNLRGGEYGIGTILVSREPFSPADRDRLRQTVEAMAFEMVLAPDGTSSDPIIAKLAQAGDLEGLFATYLLDISPPTDDRPFFFHMLRLSQARDRTRWELSAQMFNMKSVNLLISLLATVTVLTLGCIILPFTLRHREVLAGSGWLLVFFAAIGVAFMLIEISQMQRLIIFLGHPVYGLTVILFTLLVASGAGSLASDRLAPSRGRLTLGALIATLALFGLFSPWLVQTFAASTTPVRIGLAVALLALPGVLMGMAFPFGMRLAGTAATTLGPWLWGVNGATSVCASVAAMALSLTFGISATFWMGVAAYGLAALAFVASLRRMAAAP
ncbi:MAG: hypothetical protein HYX76_07780 [Acidobacteria bacterium]|nr:hypothetical protein [Acidobacteriota bacterium]